MKISNSKKQLAKIISEKGGWRDCAEFSAQDKDGEVFHYAAKPTIGAGREVWSHKGCIGEGEFTAEKLPNWHQTILSRDEYFHLYPAPVEVVVENKTTCHLTVTDKPTIEQLAADYHNRKDYAERKQQEADAATEEAEAALSQLIIACADLGFEIKPKGKLESSGAGVIDKPQDKASALSGSELYITDWLDLQIGDEVEYVSGTVGGFSGEPGVVSSIDHSPDGGKYRIRVALQNGRSLWCDEWRFIRRPAKGESNA